MDYWKVFEEEEGVEVDLGAVEEDGVGVLEVIYVDLGAAAIMVVLAWLVGCWLLAENAVC